MSRTDLTALVLWLPGNVVEPLVTLDKDGKAQPGVAELEMISEDQKTYTFTIRDAKFSNGAPVTAQDVVYSLTTMQKSPITTYNAPYEVVESITASGDKAVTVKLSRPKPAFFRGMGGMSGLDSAGGRGGPQASRRSRSAPAPTYSTST